jgi:hypothetical protein
MIPVATDFAAQAKSAVMVPGGLGFTEFRGYEDWQSVGPSQTRAQSVIRLIPANRDIWQERAINPVEIVALDALDLLVVVDNESDTLSSVDEVCRSFPSSGDWWRVFPIGQFLAIYAYLAGKIDQWYFRTDGKGVVFIVNASTPEEAKDTLEKFPLGQAGLMGFDYIPLGPLSPLRIINDMVK